MADGISGNNSALANADIRHVFVLMFENRSFDHMFALSGISGIQAAVPNDPRFKSVYNGTDYPFTDGAPNAMPTDPLHDFCAVAEQLCGENTPCPHQAGYPRTNNYGFMSSYAHSSYRGHSPGPTELPEIMAGLDTAKQAPAFLDLANAFVICDHWYSSLPGPTWPNRFFAHGASSSGLDDEPKSLDMLGWYVSGFRFPNGSLFDALGHGNWRVYHDQRGAWVGRIPQVAALHNVHYRQCRGLQHFESDLPKTDDEADQYVKYTFIEPAYGDIVSGNYAHGSSQHPMDGLASGNNLLARVYAAIRNSPVWKHSLLIVTHDEHGGFYDSAAPIALQPPGDNPAYGYNRHGFDFSRSGVRVPALLASPWLPRGELDSTPYDHSSISATVRALFGTRALTERDTAANNLLAKATGTSRDDCPEELTMLPEPEMREEGSPSPDEAFEQVPDEGNLPAFISVVRKAEHELMELRGDPMLLAPDLPPSAMTKAEARIYLETAIRKLRDAHDGPEPIA